MKQYPEHHPWHNHLGYQHHGQDRNFDVTMMPADKWNTKEGTTIETIREFNKLVVKINRGFEGNLGAFADKHPEEYRIFMELTSQIFYQPDELPERFPELYQEGSEERK